MSETKRQYHKEYYAKNKARWKLTPEKHAEKLKRDRGRKEYYAAYREKHRVIAAAWRAANRTRQRKWAKEFYAANAERLTKKQQDYRARHPEKINAAVLRRNARKKEQAHPALDHAKVVLLMAECRRLSRLTGEKYHLDHIIPLDVGGWHHQDNLQPLPAKLNASKRNNPVWEMDGYKSWRDVPVFLWPRNLVMVYYDLLIG